MADNVQLNLATVGGGKTIAAEDIGSLMFQRVKLALGAAGTDLGDVSNVNPLSVTMGGASVSAFGDLITAENTPLVQMNFVYGTNTQTGTSITANSATVDTNAGRLRLQTGVNVAGSAIFSSRRPAQYRPGQGMTTRFTCAFTTGAANSTQIVGFGTSTNGYFFGYNGVNFGVLHRNNGSDTWTAQTAWNGDKCNGSGVSGFTIDSTKGNVFQIRYPFLGYGVITFWILNPVTATWILCHTIQYPNSTATLQLSNAQLYFYTQALNSGNNTNLTMYVGSVAALLSGALSFVGNPKWTYDNSKTVTAETSMFGLRNCTTYNGVTNRAIMRLNQLSIAGGNNNATGIAVCRLRIGATLGGVPAYTPINGSTADNGVTLTSANSIASADTAATTSTGGSYIFGTTFNVVGNITVDLSSYSLFVAPGEVLTCGVYSSTSALNSVVLNWSEDT